MTSRRSKWRDTYKVHPAADKFPMMSGEELDKLGENIKTNGLLEPITVDGDRLLLDGRNRLEAMERAGVELIGGWWHETVYQDDDPVAFIISKNLHRRHLTPQQQLDLIVAVRMADNKPGHDGPVSKGGRGKINPVKAAVIADIKAANIKASERTVKRAIAKAEGKTPKAKAKPETDVRVRGFLHRANEAADMALADDLKGIEITEEIKQACYRASTCWIIVDVCLGASPLGSIEQARAEYAAHLATLDGEALADECREFKLLCASMKEERKNGASTLPQDGRNEAVDDPTLSNDDIDIGDIPACLDRRGRS